MNNSKIIDYLSYNIDTDDYSGIEEKITPFQLSEVCKLFRTENYVIKAFNKFKSKKIRSLNGKLISMGIQYQKERQFQLNQSHDNLAPLKNIIENDEYDQNQIILVNCGDQICSFNQLDLSFTISQNLHQIDKINHPTLDSVIHSFLIQISNLLQYLHKMQISHMDIKPQNLLIDSSNHVTLIDFGSCNWYGANDEIDRAWNMTIGTQFFMPDVNRQLEFQEYDQYQLGLTFQIIYSKQLPQDHEIIFGNLVPSNYILKQSECFESSSNKDIIKKLIYDCKFINQ